MRSTFLLFFLAAFSTVAHGVQSHCSSDEDIVFSCSLAESSKVVSLCASKNLLKKQGYLTYRFGTVRKIEFEFPPSHKGSTSRFHHSHYFRAQTDRTELSFENGDYTYSVFDLYEEDSKPKSSSGVSISRGKTREEIELSCAKSVIAHWYLIDGAVPCDEENALSSCNYSGDPR
jgi:hypothetical protein